MIRAALAYAILILLPCLWLASLAYVAVERDAAERIEGLATGLQEEARAVARRAQGLLADAVRRAEEDGREVVGCAADGAILYARAADHAPEPEAAPGAEEERLYRLSLRGGESFEHERGDPARAADAYAFYLGRIPSRTLRACLEYRLAGALLAAAAVSPPDGEVAAGILDGLFTGARGVLTEEGLPVDLLAASRLLALGGDRQALRNAAAARLAEDGPSLSTPLLEHFVADFGLEGTELATLAARRRDLEAAVAAHPEILAARDEVLLPDGRLLFARPLPAAPGARPVRGIRLASADLWPLPNAGLELRVEMEGSPPESPGRATEPVRLAPGGAVLARVVVEDPARAENVAGIEHRRNVMRGLVALLAVVTLAGGVALVRFLQRERRLARLRSALLANVSHELKTPVTSIRMFAELLADRRLGAGEARRLLELLRSESVRLGGLFENLLDLARFGRGEEVVPLEPVDLGACLGRLAEAFRVRAAEKKIDFTIEGLEDGAAPEVVVQANAAAVERIVLNLLDNAVKYGRADGARVRLALAAVNGEARIAVSDNGPGIPRRERERVFEEFYRLRYEDYAVKGTGLGLSIARRLARKMGGDVTLASQEGEGSTFTLKLPVA